MASNSGLQEEEKPKTITRYPFLPNNEGAKARFLEVEQLYFDQKLLKAHSCPASAQPYSIPVQDPKDSCRQRLGGTGFGIERTMVRSHLQTSNEQELG